MNCVIGILCICFRKRDQHFSRCSKISRYATRPILRKRDQHRPQNHGPRKTRARGKSKNDHLLTMCNDYMPRPFFDHFLPVSKTRENGDVSHNAKVSQRKARTRKSATRATKLSARDVAWALSGMVNRCAFLFLGFRF